MVQKGEYFYRNNKMNTDQLKIKFFFTNLILSVRFRAEDYYFTLMQGQN